METSEVVDFLAAGCEIAVRSPNLFDGLFQATNADPCTTGCAYFEGGRCDAYRQILKKRNENKNNTIRSLGESVKDEAARRGISISQVRKERRG